MAESNVVRKQAENQMNLYRLMRLQNRENSFIFRDHELMTYLKISYQHFPLDTIPHSELLKTFWKLVSTHYFKKLDQDELYRLTYIRNLFSKNKKPALPSQLRNHKSLSSLSEQLNDVFSSAHLQHIYEETQQDPETRIWLKELAVKTLQHNQQNKIMQIGGKRQNKSKHIAKPVKPMKKSKKKYQGKNKKQIQLLQHQDELDNMLQNYQSQFSELSEQNLEEQKDNIDDQIKRLEKLLNQNANKQLSAVDNLEARIMEGEQTEQKRIKESSNQRDARCIEGLIHSLQEKQIAQSVGKVVNCEKRDGQIKFQIQYESALNLMPQMLNQKALKKLNQLRQTSLLKFYRTGAKSTHSYICQNYAGFTDLCSNRMTASRHKDKDYLQIMKKGPSPQQDIKQAMEQFDICHHCKLMYPGHLLTTCKFVSDRQSMPKISEHQTDFGDETFHQKSRVSQRFVSKHRNCLTGYAKIHEEYVCGRKFCKSCLKDNYGTDWMRSNNGCCPFCEGICSCTRCIRNEKMNKLKAFFISLGGDITKLQNSGLIEKLLIKPDDVPSKTKTKLKKSLKVAREGKTKFIKKQQVHQPVVKQAVGRPRKDRQWQGPVIEEQIEKWSSTAEKEILGWRRSVRTKTARVY